MRRPPFNALVLLDPRHLDIYFENETEVIRAVNTIKSDHV